MIRGGTPKKLANGNLRFSAGSGTLGRYFDTNCPFHGAYYTAVTFYDGSGEKLAGRKAQKVSFIC